MKAGGCAAAARASALEKLKALFPLADRLPDKAGAAALKDFLLAMAERKA